MATTPAIAQIDITAAETEAVEVSVKDKLKDPYSAVIYVKDSDGRFVCGIVNAKNAMGGYTGAVPFISMMFKGAPEVGIPPRAAIVGFGETAAMQCDAKGIRY